jgi:dUTP pyrophosphatase
MDLRADIDGEIILNPGDIKFIPTGLMISIPYGYEGQIRPRSGLALRHGIGMVNSPGTIDPDYRGEVGIILINWGKKPFKIKRGDRIAQLLITKVYRANLIETDTLDITERGTGGFGHTGKS